MYRDPSEFRKRFKAYKDGKSVREIYGLPGYKDGTVQYEKDGVQYNINPNVVGAELINVTTPEITVTGRDLTKPYDSAYLFNDKTLNEAIRKRMYNTITPVGYDIGLSFYDFITGANRRTYDPFREALWAKYLGLDYYRNTDGSLAEVAKAIIPSDYKMKVGNPTYGLIYTLNPDLFKYAPMSNPLHPENIKTIDSRMNKEGKNFVQNVTDAYKDDMYNVYASGLGTFTYGRGKDDIGKYMTFYDDWDLNFLEGGIKKLNLPESVMKYIRGDMLAPFGIGHPFTLADKAYYKNGKLPGYGGGRITTGGAGVTSVYQPAPTSEEAQPTIDVLERIANFLPYVGTIQDWDLVGNGNIGKIPSAVIGTVADIFLPGLRSSYKAAKAYEAMYKATPKIADKIKYYKASLKAYRNVSSNVGYLFGGLFEDILDDLGYQYPLFTNKDKHQDGKLPGYEDGKEDDEDLIVKETNNQYKWLSGWLQGRAKQMADNIDAYTSSDLNGSSANLIHVSPIPILDMWDRYRLHHAREIAKEQTDRVKDVPIYDLRLLGQFEKAQDMSYNLDNFLQMKFGTQGAYYKPTWNNNFKDEEIFIAPKGAFLDRSTPLHEMVHAATNKYQIQQAAINEILGGSLYYKTRTSNYKDKYLDDPSEVYSRLMLFRYDNKLTPNYKVTKKDLERWRKSDTVNGYNLINRYDDDVLLKLFNDVAMNNTDYSSDVLFAANGKLSGYSNGKIRIKPANRGKFNATKKRTGKTTEELTHSKNPLTRKRAIFALNAKKWNHK